MRTKHGANADPWDRAYTPGVLAEAIVMRLLLPQMRSQESYQIADLGCGGGAFGRALANMREMLRVYGREVEITSYDIDPGATSGTGREVIYGDLLSETAPAMQVDYVISNPPFRYATEFIARGLAYVRPGGLVFMLLPSTFFGSAARADAGVFDGYWRGMNGAKSQAGRFAPTEVSALVHRTSLIERPSFSGPAGAKGSPMSTFDVGVWQRGSHATHSAAAWQSERSLRTAIRTYSFMSWTKDPRVF